LDKLENENIDYDAIILIRGGGSNLDLACFDDYSLNARLAQAYFPIFSGIGHERDTSVTDMIAHTRLKTPTAVAEFIVQHNEKFETIVSDLFGDIMEYTREILINQKEKIRELSFSINQNAQSVIHSDQNYLKEFGFMLNNLSLKQINKNNHILVQKGNQVQFISKEIFFKNHFDLKNKISSLSEKTSQLLKRNHDELPSYSNITRPTNIILDKSNQQLDFIDQIIQLSDPKNLLKKGFSISRINGKAITNSEEIQPNQILETELHQGIIKSKIIKE
jgi:exodeoxyribonuclease VII large subunit